MPSHLISRGPSWLVGAGITLIGLTGALAQPSGPSRPHVPDPNSSENSELQDPRSTGSICPGDDLSEKLERCKGVIRPPSGITPDNTIRPPDTGTTPVIPPPGTPGGGPNIELKG